MKIYFYWIDGTNEGERMRERLEMFRVGDSEHFHSIETLSERLRVEMNPSIVVVILCVNKAEFTEVYDRRKFFSDFRLILVLPDIDEDIITKGFECFPRFVTYANSDYTDVLSVLNKMSKNNEDEYNAMKESISN